MLVDQIVAARETRKTWSFPTDGVVVKALDHKIRVALGTGTTGPNWAAAFKYPPTQAKTRLLDIDVQIGRTGVLTPVARLEPVQLDGTVVSNATLHNFDEVARKDIRVGDIVVIEKAGEIIPILVEVDMASRSELPYKDRYVPPTHCQSPTVKDKSALRCSNSTCKGRVLQQLVYFVSKAAMDIQHVGEALLASLVGHKLNSPADLYTLTAADITAYYKDGSKIAARALASIEASKSQPAWRVLAGLGIPGVGSNTSKQLLKVYGSIAALSWVDEDSLRECDGIGEVTAADVVAWFNTDENENLWTDLVYTHGLQGVMEKKAPASERLAGQVWVITGTLSRERGDFANFLENHGAKVGSGVTSKTTHLLVGDKPGASKTTKTLKLKLPVIAEAQIHMRQTPRRRSHFSLQLKQTRATTSIKTSGKTADIASSIVALTRLQTSSAIVSGASTITSSCTVESSLASVGRRPASSTSARFMPSAQLPCTGVFIRAVNRCQ
jgi:DNA ligase (NAD+)